MTAAYCMGFTGLGGLELLLVMLVLLLLFGARDAPRILRRLSGLLAQLRHAANEFKHEVMYSDMRTEDDARATDGMAKYGSLDNGADEPPDEPVEPTAGTVSDLPTSPKEDVEKT